MRMPVLPDERGGLRQSAKIRQHSATPHADDTTILGDGPQVSLLRQAQAATVSDAAHIQR